MATARIDAAVVYRAAESRRLKDEADMEAELKDWRDYKLKTPVVEGRLWWKRERYRTEAEVDAIYINPYRNFGWFCGKGTCRAVRLRDLAKAALTKGITHGGIGKGYGDGFVTLDVDDVRFLGLAGDPQ